MDSSYRDILSPLGESIQAAQPHGASRVSGSGSGKPVVGLLNNSKPNVSYFLEALADELRRSGEYEVVTVAKPRSAAPYADIAALADRCNYVINAVAD